jgi:peptidoglycan hydrolase-like protein with peptidoglycan-binding domain
MRKIIKGLIFLILFCSMTSSAFAAGLYFQEGDRGPEIAQIQNKLKALGYMIGKSDGIFSLEAKHAVLTFQKRHHLKADGIVDEKTYRALMGRDMPKQNQALGKKITDTALRYKGTPYKYGGISPKGFDCSGYVWYVYKEHGKNIPRTADRQYEAGKKVSYKELQPGDVVFFSTYEKGASHCGIFLGKGKFIHASSSRGVMVSSLSDSYWKPRYLGARRLI